MTSAASAAVSRSACTSGCPAIEVELVWGPGFGGEPPQGVTVLDRPASLLEPLLRADAVVCAGGQTMLEAAAAGAPALVLEGAPNQRAQIAALAARGAIVQIGEEEAPTELDRLLGIELAAPTTLQPGTGGNRRARGASRSPPSSRPWPEAERLWRDRRVYVTMEPTE